MIDTDRRRSEDRRGDVDDLDGVDAEGIPWQLRRRRAASWRCEPLDSGLGDPWGDRHPVDWTEREVDAWVAAAEQLRSQDLYGRWQVPESVRVAWRRRRGCSCCRGAA